MKLLKHLWSQPFIFATGAAALIHSTWSLGTFFSGEQPADPFRLILWLIPSALIAFSLDIGQIFTSAEIRAGQRSWQKYATFGVFALATYFLQFVYISSHMPNVGLAAGIRSDWLWLVTLIRDSGVFILPLLLPLSTLLYTFSQEAPAATPAEPLPIGKPGYDEAQLADENGINLPELPPNAGASKLALDMPRQTLSELRGAQATVNPTMHSPNGREKATAT